MARFGAPLEGLGAADFAERGSFFRMGREPVCIDILTDIPGVDFDAAWRRGVRLVIDAASDLKANFISADDLMSAKLAAGRPQDLADAEALRKAAASDAPSAARKPKPVDPNR